MRIPDKPVKPKNLVYKGKQLDKRLIERAMSETKSNRGAARFCGVNIKTYERYARMHKDENGVDYYEKHRNWGGKGIPKMTLSASHNAGLMDILEGRVNPIFFTIRTQKERLIKEGYIKEECAVCGFNEKRVLDLKVPLIMNFKDGNKKHWKLDNLEFLCYNHYFLKIGEVFQDKQIKAMEDFTQLQSKPIDWDLPKSQEDMILKSINIDNKHSYLGNDTADTPKDGTYGDDLISYFKPFKK